MSIASPAVQTCIHAIDCVTNGLAVDGQTPLHTRTTFSSNPTAKRAAAIALARIVQHLKPAPSTAQLTSLTIKLLNYLTRSPNPIFETCLALPTSQIVRSLMLNPDLMTNRAGIAAMLRTAAQSLARTLKEELAMKVPPRRLIASLGNGYALTEATAPAHVREDGLIIGHCAANLYDTTYLAQLPPNLPTELKIFALTYWRTISTGRARLFSLMHNGLPIVTMNYRTTEQAIIEIAMQKGTSRHDNPHLPALCRAIVALRNQLVLRFVHGLPNPPKSNLAISIHGQYVPIDASNAPSLLQAQVTLPKRTTWRQLNAFLQNPYLHINISHVNTHHLRALTHVPASVEIYGPTIKLPNLNTLENDLRLHSRNPIHLPALSHVGGSQYAFHTPELRQPKLVHIDRNHHTEQVRHIHQPKLTYIGGHNVIGDCAFVHQPNLAPRSDAATGFLPLDLNIIPPQYRRRD